MKERVKVNFFIKLSVFIFIVFCSVTIVVQQFEFNALTREKEQLSMKIDEYTKKVDELKEELDEPFDDEYVIKVAREKLNYRLPDEIIFYNDLAK